MQASRAVRARARVARDAGRRVVPGRAPELRGARLPARATRRPSRSRTPPSSVRSSRRPGATSTSRRGASRRRFARSGVGPGDRVVGYLPNIVEAVVAFHACASLGATWSSCSPDFGLRSVVDRFAQIEPRVLLTVDGYRYGGRDHDRLEVVRALQQAMPSLERTVVLGYLDPEPSLAGLRRATSWERLRRGGRRRAALVRAGAVRPPAVGALQLRHDRPARRRSCTGTAGSCSSS